MSMQQKQFMVACGQTVSAVNFKQAELYTELIREEVVRELFPAWDKFIASPTHDNTVELLYAIGGSLVVVEGLAFSLGIDPALIKARVDISNLSKIPEGKAKIEKRAYGKILKPPSFITPYLDDLANRINKPYTYAGLIENTETTSDVNSSKQGQVQ